MYNRYVPQADGSFRRSQIPEPVIRQETAPPAYQVSQERSALEQSENPAPKQNSPQPQHNPLPMHPHNQYDHPAPSVGNFLRGLLPQNFDAEDLMVVLLLLLMSGNSGSDQNGALMTLVIYLFL